MGMVETPDGYLVAYNGQNTKLDIKYTNDESKKVSYNIATTLVNKGIFDHSYYEIWTPDSVIESRKWTDYTYEDRKGVINKDKERGMRVTGTNWITHFDDANAHNMVHP